MCWYSLRGGGTEDTPRSDRLGIGVHALRVVGEAGFELALEAEEAAERNRWESPIIRDGDFMMRKPVDRAVVSARSS